MSHWINYVGSEIHVCGAHGKIIERFSLDQEDAARTKLGALLAGNPAREPKPVKVTKAQRDVLVRAREGIQFRAPALIGVFVECAERGWIVADPTEYGLHVTLTASGMTALSDA